MFGWTQWDIHLAKFKNKQVNILEIGVYKGDAMQKFAQVFLDSEPESHYYGIDTWEGSPEYVDVDFKEIEKKTLEKKKNSPSKARIHLIKKESIVALPKLLSKGIKFDIIYIDASHVAKDVLFDGVLSINMLKENGVLIFDDYLWKKLEPSLFTPRPAIDAILEIYKDVINVLYSGYQVIIEKVPPKQLPKRTIEKGKKGGKTLKILKKIYHFKK
jgi:predicted O-methyltransferase YrrM